MPADVAAPPAPAAPAAKPAAPALPNAPKVEIPVSKLGEPAAPAPPPKPGSARERLFKELEGKAKKDSFTREPVDKPEEPKPDTAKAPEKPEIDEPEVDDPEKPKPDTAKAPEAKDDKKPKANPWKLMEEYKTKLAAAEAKILETEKRAIPEAKWKERETELEQKSKRLTELEEEIRYVNYSKSEEFKTKYQAPYEKAWEQAMSELSEIKIETGEGEFRDMTANDLLKLVNLPLGEAKAMANEIFGDLSPEVMAHRKSIKDLFEKQAAALEDARKTGAEREKTTLEQRQKQYGEVTNQIREIYAKANEEVKVDPKYGRFFTPVEGDQEINQRLAKGYELADRAFSENPLNAKTPEERASMVKRHAAVRNRCAAFGRLVYENGLKDTKIAELQKIVDDFKASEPDLNGSKKDTTPAVSTNRMENLLGALRKKVKQV